MVNLPPAEMNYKCFDEMPNDLRKYKKGKTDYRFVSCVKKEIKQTSGYTTWITTKWVSTYEWWFMHRGKIYMHVNTYIGAKKGEIFDYNGRNYAKPLEAWWVDADGKTAPYEHSNRKVKQ